MLQNHYFFQGKNKIIKKYKQKMVFLLSIYKLINKIGRIL
jgi:hypothetical protein